MGFQQKIKERAEEELTIEANKAINGNTPKNTTYLYIDKKLFIEDISRPGHLSVARVRAAFRRAYISYHMKDKIDAIENELYNTINDLHKKEQQQIYK